MTFLKHTVISSEIYDKKRVSCNDKKRIWLFQLCILAGNGRINIEFVQGTMKSLWMTSLVAECPILAELQYVG